MISKSPKLVQVGRVGNFFGPSGLPKLANLGHFLSQLSRALMAPLKRRQRPTAKAAEAAETLAASQKKPKPAPTVDGRTEEGLAVQRAVLATSPEGSGDKAPAADGVLHPPGTEEGLAVQRAVLATSPEGSGDKAPAADGVLHPPAAETPSGVSAELHDAMYGPRKTKSPKKSKKLVWKDAPLKILVQSYQSIRPWGGKHFKLMGADFRKRISSYNERIERGEEAGDVLSEQFLNIRSEALRRKIKKIAGMVKPTGVPLMAWAVRVIKDVAASLQNQHRCGSHEYSAHDESSEDEGEHEDDGGTGGTPLGDGGGTPGDGGGKKPGKDRADGDDSNSDGDDYVLHVPQGQASTSKKDKQRAAAKAEARGARTSSSERLLEKISEGADRRTDKMIDFFRCFLTHHQPVVHNVQHNNTAVVQHVNNGSAVNSAEDS